VGAKKNIQTQENQYTEWKPSNTPDIQAVRDFQDMPGGLEPSLQAQYDRAQQRNANRLNSSYAQNIPQSARLAMQQQGDRDYQADYGSALNQGYFDANRAKMARQMGLAEMTMGRPLNTKSTTTTQEKGGFWRGLAGGLFNVGTSFLGARLGGGGKG
jgi:hypothetical protein